VSRAPRFAAGRARALGVPTRGTTTANRLRRVDNFLTDTKAVAAALTGAAEPLVVDLGYGASPVTTLELAARLRARHGDVLVVGLEIDPERVRSAEPAARAGAVEFAVGGFELASRRPHLVRALNVLRQYQEGDALAAWDRLRRGLGPGGVIIEGTCDELGRVGGWVLLDASGPQALTLSCAPRHLDRPATLAERLPKALIHHNVPGEPIHRLIADLDAGWAAAAPLAVFSPVQRWQAAVRALTAAGWPVLDGPRAHRQGRVTVPWSRVQPVGGGPVRQ
jgi:hypothetical protein